MCFKTAMICEKECWAEQAVGYRVEYSLQQKEAEGKVVMKTVFSLAKQ